MGKADLEKHCLLIHRPGFPDDVTYKPIISTKLLDDGCRHLASIGDDGGGWNQTRTLERLNPVDCRSGVGAS